MQVDYTKIILLRKEMISYHYTSEINTIGNITSFYEDYVIF